VSNISTSVGTAWPTPVYDRAGNMTSMPQPKAPGSSYAAVYDAWNRLVRLSASGSTVAGYAYDGRHRRTLKNSYVSGVLSQVRHLYSSDGWQVLEERVGSSTSAERQFVWGLRYVDDLVLRDRDATGSGTLTERLYALQDALFNVTALADTTGTVQERYVYDAYGIPSVLAATFAARSASSFDWEVRYKGYRWDVESGLYQVRRRQYHPTIGAFVSRDPIGLDAGDTNLYRFVLDRPTVFNDPTGANPVAGTLTLIAANPVGTAVVVGILAVGTIIYFSSSSGQETAGAVASSLAQLVRRICDLIPRVQLKTEPKTETKTEPKPQPKPDEINVPDPRPPERKKDPCQEGDFKFLQPCVPNFPYTTAGQACRACNNGDAGFRPGSASIMDGQHWNKRERAFDPPYVCTLPGHPMHPVFGRHYNCEKVVNKRRIPGRSVVSCICCLVTADNRAEVHTRFRCL
jgi:RHS repeat-associated protein